MCADNGVWGILFIALAMGSVNGVSMKVGNCTTNAVTGHFLSLASGLFDLCTETMSIAAKSKMLLSIGVVVSLCSGIATGQVTADRSDFDSYKSFNPTFSILGFACALVLVHSQITRSKQNQFESMVDELVNYKVLMI